MESLKQPEMLPLEKYETFLQLYRRFIVFITILSFLLRPPRLLLST